MNNTIEAEKLIIKWTPLIKSLSRKFSNQIMSEEDLFNEGVLAIYNAIPSYNPDIATIDTYVYRCISNRIMSIAFQNSFVVHVPSGSLAILKNRNTSHFRFSARDPNQKAYISNNTREIQELIDKYDRDHIARMYFIESRKYKEISELIGKSITLISKHINKIREIIRKKYAIEINS